jgi:hypothetical protein
LAISFVASLASVASASDWYVDAVNGSNANDGSSPSTAWRTITHAVANVPLGAVETINIAAGTYSQALGESFPIAMKPGQQLIGAAGEPRPVVTANGVHGTLLFSFESTPAQPLQFGADTRLEHLELRRASVGVGIVAQAGEVSPTLSDLRIERMHERGVTILGAGGLCDVALERVRIGATSLTVLSHGIVAYGSAAPGVKLRGSDCVFADAGGIGVFLEGEADAHFQRCTFDGLGREALYVSVYTSQTVRLACVDSSITYCHTPLTASTGHGHLDAEFTRCTLASNAHSLFVFDSLPGGSVDLSFDTSIVVTDGPLLHWSVNANVEATRSLISDGSFDGINGCFSGDPGFRNGADGDFRLRWGSPCIDAAFVDAPAGTRDVVGSPRNLDGNLDTLGKTDLGAYEFQPLELTTTGAIGSSLRLENWGPDSPSTIYWARTGLTSSQTTPFGAFQLNSQFARPFRFTTAGASTPNVTLRPIPNQLALVGHTFSFQALTDSPAAPLSKAFTNGVEFTVIP